MEFSQEQNRDEVQQITTVVAAGVTSMVVEASGRTRVHHSKKNLVKQADESKAQQRLEEQQSQVGFAAKEALRRSTESLGRAA